MKTGFSSAVTEDAERLQAQLGASIHRHRRALGWSQQDLADRLGVTMAYVSLLERGERAPAMPVLVALAQVFGTSIDAIFGWPSADPWVQEGTELLKSVPTSARPAVMAMLRGVVASGGAPGVMSGSPLVPANEGAPRAPAERAANDKRTRQSAPRSVQRRRR